MSGETTPTTGQTTCKRAREETHICISKPSTSPALGGALHIKASQVTPRSTNAGGAHGRNGFRTSGAVGGPNSLHPSPLRARTLNWYGCACVRVRMVGTVTGERERGGEEPTARGVRPFRGWRLLEGLTPWRGRSVMAESIQNDQVGQRKPRKHSKSRSAASGPLFRPFLPGAVDTCSPRVNH